jgi:Transposase DNA-binding
MPSSFALPLWAAQVAAATPLPDSRLNTRLERLLTQLASKPLDAFPQAASDCHQAKATYRFLSKLSRCFTFPVCTSQTRIVASLIPPATTSLPFGEKARELTAPTAASSVHVCFFFPVSRSQTSTSFLSFRLSRSCPKLTAQRRGPTLVPLRVLPGTTLEVVLPTGLVVRAPAGADAAAVATLVVALRAASC